MRVVGTARQLFDTSNTALIQAVIASNDETAKHYLAANNPNLSRSDFETLVSSKSGIRKAVAKSAHVPLDVLAMLRADEDEDVRLQALRNPLTTVEEFREALLTQKFSVHYKRMLACDVKAVATLEVFDLLWQNKNLRDNLIWAIDEAIHTSSPVDSRIRIIIHDLMESGEALKDIRQAYASSWHSADPEILDSLKNDPHRPVINALAENPLAWVSTHEHLVDNHKTPFIRISIARVTKDKDLLNKIYYGTKSKDIREAVTKNPLFTP